MINQFIINHKQIEFDNNPRNLNCKIVFKGTISFGSDPLDYINIYETTPELLIKLGKQFKQLAPAAERIYIWGPCDWMSLDEDDRTFVTAAFL